MPRFPSLVLKKRKCKWLDNFFFLKGVSSCKAPICAKGKLLFLDQVTCIRQGIRHIREMKRSTWKGKIVCHYTKRLQLLRFIVLKSPHVMPIRIILYPQKRTLASVFIVLTSVEDEKQDCRGGNSILCFMF